MTTNLSLFVSNMSLLLFYLQFVSFFKLKHTPQSIIYIYLDCEKSKKQKKKTVIIFETNK